jgi:hypothetical protein
MPGLNGLELARRLAAGAGPGNTAPQVVFTTAHEQYALQAFDSEAFDYLLKPIRLERLQRTVARLKETLAERARPRRPRIARHRGAAGRDAAPARRARARMRTAECSAVERGAGRRPVAMDTRGARRGDAPDRGRRSHLLPEQRQVHQRLHRRRRTPDPHPAAPAARTARRRGSSGRSTAASSSPRATWPAPAPTSAGACWSS